jgi:hypothetical protein
MPAIPRQRCGGGTLEVNQFATGQAHAHSTKRLVGNVFAQPWSPIARRIRFAFRLETGRLLGPRAD